MAGVGCSFSLGMDGAAATFVFGSFFSSFLAAARQGQKVVYMWEEGREREGERGEGQREREREREREGGGREREREREGREREIGKAPHQL